MEVKLNIGEFNNSYAAWSSEYSSKVLLQYTNQSDKQMLIKSMTMPMGTGSGTFTAGITATGNGGQVVFYVTVNGIKSSSATVSNVITPTPGSTGTYPLRASMINQTVSFDDDVIVEPGETVNFVYASNFTQQGNDTVFVWDNERAYAEIEEVAGKAIIWQYNKSKDVWEKVLFLHIYNGDVWSDISLIHEYHNTWQDKT